MVAYTYFEDFVVGARFETPPVTVTEAEIIEFATKFDPQPMHTDPAAAANPGFAISDHTEAMRFTATLDYAPTPRVRKVGWSQSRTLFVQTGLFGAPPANGVRAASLAAAEAMLAREIVAAPLKALAADPGFRPPPPPPVPADPTLPRAMPVAPITGTHIAPLTRPKP